MSVTIHLYNMSERRNKLNKTLPSTSYAHLQLSGDFREPVNYTDPDVLVEYTGTGRLNMNYAFIPDLGRYYFINSIEAEGPTLYRLRMHVDVLMTYKGSKTQGSEFGIYGLSCLISRAESSLMAPGQAETSIPIYGNTSLVTGGPTGTLPGWEGSNYVYKDSGTKLKKYCLLIKGQGLPNSILPLIWLVYDIDAFKYISGQISTNITTWSGGTINNLIYRFGVLPFEMSNLVNAVAPGATYDILFPSSMDPLRLAANDGSTPLSWKMPTAASSTPVKLTWTVSVSTPSTANLCRNFKPYHRMALRFRPFGKFELDEGLIFNGVSAGTASFKVMAEVDPITGNASLFYGKSTADIYLGSANVLIEFPLATESYSAAKIASGALSVVGAAAATVATEGAASPALAAAMVNATSSAIPNISITGGYERIIDEGPVVESYRKTSPDFATVFLGRPYNAIDYIYNMTGYVEVEKVNIEGDGFGGMLDSERIELENIMKGGFYA